MVPAPAHAEPAADWDGEWDAALFRDADGEEAAAGDADEVGGRAAAPRPRNRGGLVELRYRDRDFASVSVAGSFNEWLPMPMTLGDDGTWTAVLDLEPGEHRYQFLVEETEGETWFAIDPGNGAMDREEERGWVSLLVVGPGGEVEAEDDRPFWEKERDREHRRDWDWDWDGDWGDAWNGDRDGCLGFGDAGSEGVDLTFQRVDGWSLFLLPDYRGRERFEPSFDARIGYGFTSDEWSAMGTVWQPLTPDRSLNLKVSGYAMTDFTDQNGICTDENSLAGIFFRTDYRDYFRREGGTAALHYENFGWLRVEAGVHADDYESLAREATWSFADGVFRGNRPVDEGTMRSVYGSLRLGTELGHLDLAYERSADDLLGGDFDFELVGAEYRARLGLGTYRHVDFRVKAASALAGELPVQRRFYLGGVGTVRGYPFQSLIARTDGDESGDLPNPGGEQMLLANVEYLFGIDRDFDIFVTFDTGMAWEDREADMDLDQLESSVGVGMELGHGGLRLHLAQRLDAGDHEPILRVRLNRMF
jgi:hypothetical protein